MKGEEMMKSQGDSGVLNSGWRNLSIREADRYTEDKHKVLLLGDDRR